MNNTLTDTELVATRRLELCLSEYPELHEQSAAMLRAVAAANRPVYVFAGGVYRINTVEGTARLQPLDVPALRHEVSAAVQCTRSAKQPDGNYKQVSTFPPKEVIADALASGCYPFPTLDSICRHPTMSNGRLLNTNGYNAATRLYIDGALPELKVSDKPTPIQATEALAMLSDLLSDFQFADTASYANTLALLLTLAIRPAIAGPVPVFVIQAPTPGTGKSLLASIIYELVTGTSLPMIPEIRNPDEMQKSLFAMVSDMPDALCLDNINSGLDSAALASTLTADVLKSRVLGKSEMREIPVRTVFVITANNPVMSNELVRRCASISLQPTQERPWERTGFKHPNIHTYVKEHRTQLLQAVFTVVRYWYAKGCPKPKGKPLGSFEDWYRVIGGILAAVGCTDLLGNRDEFYTNTDTVSGAWQTFVEAWDKAYPIGGVTTKDLVPLALNAEVIDEGRSDKGTQTALGRALSKNTGRIYSGYQIKRLSKCSGYTIWSLKET
jgi:putative DNA primase/helicase